jgi:hypothetical protein
VVRTSVIIFFPFSLNVRTLVIYFPKMMLVAGAQGQQYMALDKDKCIVYLHKPATALYGAYLARYGPCKATAGQVAASKAMAASPGQTFQIWAYQKSSDLVMSMLPTERSSSGSGDSGRRAARSMVASIS